jgi:hypothetical protein
LGKKKSGSFGNIFFDILTMIVLAGTIAVITISMIIYYQPNTALNPYPPAAMPEEILLPTTVPPTQQPSASFTITPVVMNTAAQPTPSLQATKTARPTLWNSGKTPEALPSLPVSSSPTSLAVDPSSTYKYQIQSEPQAIAADLFDSSRSDCKWLGVAGQVNDLEGSPVTGILVLLGGNLEYKIQNQTTITGTARNYGPAGYEFTLADHLVKSNDVLWVQLVDQSYIPLSTKVYFDTYDDCNKSLVIINFKQVR